MASRNKTAVRNDPSRLRVPVLRNAGAVARMEDVAIAAGVSLVTVSRAINQPDKLAPATLERVRAAIDRLRYVPNLTAGSLASNRTRIIAAVVPTIANSIFSDTIDGLSTALADRGYQLLLGQTHYDAVQEMRVVEAFLGRRVDGILLVRSSAGGELGARLRRAGIPVVEAWDLPARPIDMVAGFSNHDAGRAAAGYLADQGYRQLAFIGSDEMRSGARLDGFRAVAAERALPEVRSRPVAASAGVGDAAREFGALIEQWPDTRAVFCANDMLAAGVLFACRRRGIEVPKRLAVMGFADLPIAAEIEPALTTVRVPSHRIGLRAGEMLLERVLGEKVTRRNLDVGYTVVKRSSA
jgi:LacI family transcriptional regulator, gluconate utilization system Gnt-I transcriptional repressor